MILFVGSGNGGCWKGHGDTADSQPCFTHGKLGKVAIKRLSHSDWDKMMIPANDDREMTVGGTCWTKSCAVIRSFNPPSNSLREAPLAPLCNWGKGPGRGNVLTCPRCAGQDGADVRFKGQLPGSRAHDLQHRAVAGQEGTLKAPFWLWKPYRSFETHARAEGGKMSLLVRPCCHACFQILACVYAHLQCLQRCGLWYFYKIRSLYAIHSQLTFSCSVDQTVFVSVLFLVL